MAKTKFDLDMMKWVADKIQNEDYSVFPFTYKECEKCGAGYLPQFGHDCNNVIELDMHEADKADEIQIIR